MFIQPYHFVFEILVSCYEAINKGLEEFNLVFVERDKLIAWQLGASL